MSTVKSTSAAREGKLAVVPCNPLHEPVGTEGVVDRACLSKNTHRPKHNFSGGRADLRGRCAFADV
eukprot:5155719-Pyramimonas_sp.AAC.1